MLRAATAFAVVLAGLSVARSPGGTAAPGALPIAHFNDNLRSAGTLSRGVLRVALELRHVT